MTSRYARFVLLPLLIALVHATSSHAASGIWISRAEVALLPRAGPAWDNVFAEAQLAASTPILSYGSDPTNVRILAKALIFAATGQTSYRDQVKAALTSIVNSGTYTGRALALGRELAAYVIAADLIDLRTNDPTLNQQFRAKLRELLTTPTIEGPGNLVLCHEVRPNNWGTHCGATRVAIARYLDDATQLAAAAAVFKGWLGDRDSYAEFDYGSLSWQSNPDAPVGINPMGARLQGHDVDGVLPDDQRREGPFEWPPPKVQYVYEALQGALVQAELLSRAGYDAWNWEDQALLRAYAWLQQPHFNEGASYPANGDDEWQPHLIKFVYGTAYEAVVPATPGKNMGWTDWTHATRPSTCVGYTAALSVKRTASTTDRDVLVARIVVPTPPGDFQNLTFDEDGALVVLESASGESRISANVPSGGFDGSDGWKLNASANVWTYVGKPDPVRNGGINLVRLATGRRSSSARTSIKIKGKGDYPVTAADSPVTLSIIPSGSQSQCAAYRFSFATRECDVTDSQGTMRCRGRRAVQ